MDFFNDLPKRTKIIIGLVAAVFIIVLFIFLKNYQQSSQIEELESSESSLESESSEETETSEDGASREEDSSTTMMADVKGAVVNPGVYEFEEGDRVETLIEQAGGLTEDADPNQINMAQVVEDEMVIYVPTKGEVVQAPPSNGGTSNASTGENEGMVNINTATMEELMTLPGIGETKAQAIMDTREEKGGYKSIDEIKDAPGIGDATYEQIKDLIYV